MTVSHELTASAPLVSMVETYCLAFYINPLCRSSLSNNVSNLYQRKSSQCYAVRETHSQTQLQEASDTSNSSIISRDDDAISGSTSSMILTSQPLVILRPNQNVVGVETPEEMLLIALVRHLYILKLTQ